MSIKLYKICFPYNIFKSPKKIVQPSITPNRLENKALASARHNALVASSSSTFQNCSLLSQEAVPRFEYAMHAKFMASIHSLEWWRPRWLTESFPRT